MPGKVFKLIGKTLHPDGYYTATVLSEVETPKIKLWFRFDKGLIIGPEQREKLIREEQEQAAAKAKEEIPTPGFVQLAKESVVEAKTSAAAVISTTHEDSSSSAYDYSSTFQTKLGATKRKMQDSYQQLANAKKQKKVKVIHPRDLPPPQSSSKGKANVVASRKKKIITSTNKKAAAGNNNNNFFDGGGRSKPTSIF